MKDLSGYHSYTSANRATVDGGVVTALAVDDRPTLVPNGSPVLTDGALVFDGVNDRYDTPAPTPVAATVTPTQFIQLPDASGAAAGKGFTCTGLAPGPDGTWFAGNDGRTQEGDGSPYLSSVVKLSAGMTSIVAEKTTADLGLTSGSVQGVAYLETLGLVAFAHLGTNLVHFLNASDLSYVGAMPGAAISGLNGLAYDPRLDAMICCATTGTTTWRSRTTGAVLKTVTLTNDSDQIFYDTERDWLWYTTGGNGTDGVVRARAVSAMTADFAVYTIAGAKAIEGVTIRDGKLWLLNDQYYHPTGTALNRAIECPLPDLTNVGPASYPAGASTVQFVAVLRLPTSPAASTPVIQIGDSLEAPSGYAGLWTPNNTTLQLIANRISASWTVPAMTADVLVYGSINLETDTAELWVNGVSQTVKAMSGTGTTTPDTIRPGAFNVGWHSTPRWFKGEIRAIGAMVGSPNTREIVEGFVAHDIDRTDLLPADHAYKTTAPAFGGGSPDEPTGPLSAPMLYAILSGNRRRGRRS